MIPQSSCISQPRNFQHFQPVEDFSIARFIRFLKQLCIKQTFSEISDTRQAKKSKYSNHSLLLQAFSVFAFRQGSKNSLQTTIERLPKYKQTSLLKYLEVEGDSIPYRTVVDDYLVTINPDEINNVLFKLFVWCQKNKLFYNHAKSLLPDNNYHLGTDGFWVHKYDRPHAVDGEGKNCCPYCLPRTCHKGKPEEFTYWVHAFVTFVLIFPIGLQLPIYTYPLKAVEVDISKNDNDLKQECELKAFYTILPELRQKLGRIRITLLLNSLYANEPVIQLAEKLFMNYLIVRQEDSLKSIGKKCNELAT